MPDANTEKLAKSGDIKAMIELGQWYSSRADTNPLNGKTGLSWYKKAMDKGSEEGRWLYIEALLDGIDGKVKVKDALKLINKQRDANYANKIYEKGVAKQMTESGQAYLLCASELGNPYADYLIAVIYLKGKNLLKDVKIKKNEGLDRLTKLANSDFSPAVVKLSLEKISSEWQYKCSSMNPSLVKYQDLLFAIGQDDMDMFYNLIKCKGKSRNIKNYVEWTDSISKKYSSTSFGGDYVGIMIECAPLNTDTVLIDRLKSYIAPTHKAGWHRIDLMELKVPERQMSAAKRILDDASYRNMWQSVYNDVLVPQSKKGNLTALKMLYDKGYTQYNLGIPASVLVQAYKGGMKQALPGILKAAEELDEDAIAFLCKDAATGTAEMQGTLGLVYANKSYAKHNDATARKWLDLAVRNGNSDYKQKCLHLYKVSAPKQEKKKVPQKKSSGVEFQESGIRR